VSDSVSCIVEAHTASDGYCWQYRHYRSPASATPAGRVVYLHGIQSHGGWYEQSCRHLAQSGFDVFFLDRRGSGLNEQDRGDTPSFRRLLDDVAEFLQGLRSAGPGKTFVAAVSWGGKLATALQKRRPGLTDGLALICPGFFPQIQLSPAERLRILWARLTSPRRLFPVPLDEPELFTATPHWLEFLRSDRVSLHQATARFLVESVRLDLYLRRVPRHVRVPVLLVLAGQDRIIENAPTQAYIEKFNSPDRQIIEYPEAHHTLEFEPDPSIFLGDLTRWLLQRTGSEDDKVTR
jgi:alpha-beta hydrolase superfamily lysophospholipase